MRSWPRRGHPRLPRRLLPPRLVVYFVLALWLFRGRNCGYARVMGKWSMRCITGGGASSCSTARSPGRRGSTLAGAGGAVRRISPRCLVPGPGWVLIRCTSLFDSGAGPVGAAGVFWCGSCGWCRWTARTSDVPADHGERRVLRPTTQTRPGPGVPAGPLAPRGGVGDRLGGLRPGHRPARHPGLSRAGPRLRLPDALARRDRDRPSQN